MNFINEIDKYLNDLKNIIDKIDRNEVDLVIKKILQVHKDRGSVYIFGNGGSASTASHFVNDFNKAASENLDKRFKFFCLNDNISTLMAISNDISYDEIFKEQLKNFLEEKDLVIGISGSGNSKNIIKGIEYANSMGVDTVGLIGYDGGELKKIAKHSIHIPVNDMQKVEDLHLVLDHLMMIIIKAHLEKGKE